jgi:hypothetical protein
VTIVGELAAEPLAEHRRSARRRRRRPEGLPDVFAAESSASAAWSSGARLEDLP